MHDVQSLAPAPITGTHLDQPIAFGHMEIGTQLILAAVDRAAMLTVFARGDRQQRSVVQENPNALSQDRQTEFSNARCCPQLGQRKSRMGPLSKGRQVRCGVDHATL
jgi:hypothetical protein